MKQFEFRLVSRRTQSKDSVFINASLIGQAYEAACHAYQATHIVERHPLSIRAAFTVATGITCK